MAVQTHLPYRNHVTERQVGPDEDCLWMSGIEFLREGYDPTIPHTHAEGDALRKASGDTGFSSVADFRKGVAKRYPHVELNPSQTGADNIIAHLKQTGVPRVAMVSGKLTNMSDHFRRWYKTFLGGHTVFVAYIPGVGFWWCDPGAPETLSDGTKYLGEPISEAQLRKFIGTYGYSALLRNALQKPAVVVPPPPLIPATGYTQAQLDAAVAAARADQKTSDAAVCNARVATATATATVAGYNSGVKAAQVAVNAVPLK